MRRYLGGYQRPRFGFVTTWENERGETISAHRFGGRIREQLPALVDEVLELDPSYRLVAFSTPDTILTDLEGARDLKTNPVPEAAILGLIGRRDLLHPRLCYSRDT